MWKPCQITILCWVSWVSEYCGGGADGVPKYRDRDFLRQVSIPQLPLHSTHFSCTILNKIFIYIYSLNSEFGLDTILICYLSTQVWCCIRWYNFVYLRLGLEVLVQGLEEESKYWARELREIPSCLYLEDMRKFLGPDTGFGVNGSQEWHF